jgi:hypothetical protein
MLANLRENAKTGQHAGIRQNHLFH